MELECQSVELFWPQKDAFTRSWSTEKENNKILKYVFWNYVIEFYI